MSAQGRSLAWRAAQPVGLGVLAALGLAPFFLWYVTLFALARLGQLLVAVPTRRAGAWIGWLFGLGYFGLGLVWIVEPFLVDVARHGWMAPFALVFLAGGLALFWAAAFWFALAPDRGPWWRIGILICTWSLAEFVRAYALTGFPWAGFAQIWVDHPAALLLSWVGPQGLGAITLALGLTAGLIAARVLRAWLVGAAVAVAFVAAIGGVISGAPDVKTTGKTVRMVQPNAPQHQKWDPAMMPVFFDRSIGFTGQTPRPDLIVWPETAVPTLLEWADPAFEAIATAAGGIPVALGIQRSEGARSYNSLVYLDPDGQVAAIYDKHHLVPFGEYFPGGDLAAGLGLRGFAARDGDGYSAGPGPQVVDFGALGLALPLICYEAVFPQDATGTPERPDFLLQITNDAWFGEYVGPYQHLAQARMRAIEQGLPMVRAANTGVSAMIDPQGRLIASLPLGQAGFVDAPLPAPLPPTLYARTGDLPVLALLIAGLGIGVLRQRRTIKSV
ncbi:apolipoprotein N-acyltransferase [Rhodobacteraceae bacterium F11138]|nr:apolipoprotein N-acyltransferase [Rhodobacteraceae bacterium F11138]